MSYVTVFTQLESIYQDTYLKHSYLKEIIQSEEFEEERGGDEGIKRVSYLESKIKA